MAELSTGDFVAIQQLYARYAFMHDLCDLEGWLGCWADECEHRLYLWEGEFPRGKEALRERAKIYGMKSRSETDDLLAGHSPGFHWSSNVLIEPAEHGANGMCYHAYFHAPTSSPEALGVAGRSSDEVRGRPDPATVRTEVGAALYYRDELVKQDGKWLFKRRTLGPLGWEPKAV